MQNEAVLEPGAPTTWFVIPDAWYELGRFHLRDGTFTGWYTNFCTPVRFGPLWEATDLFLDHWLSAAGWEEWLDEDELDAAIERGLVTPALVERLQGERDQVARRLAAGLWPPEPVLRGWEEVAAHASGPVAS